jgi:hypothetical protein
MKNLLVRNLEHHQTKISVQLRIVVLTFLATVIPFTLIFKFLNVVKNASIGFLTRDPSAITKTPIYIGLFSNIGVFLWCSCAVICLFSYAIIKQNNRHQKLSKFLLSSGLLTFFLMLDDFYMFHERIFPKYLNIPEKIFYVFYIGSILFVLVKNIKVIKKTEFIILFASLGFLTLSSIVDQVPIYLISTMEDVFKIIGITTWLTYFTRLCLKELSNMVRLSSSNEEF